MVLTLVLFCSHHGRCLKKELIEFGKIGLMMDGHFRTVKVQDTLNQWQRLMAPLSEREKKRYCNRRRVVRDLAKFLEQQRDRCPTTNNDPAADKKRSDFTECLTSALTSELGRRPTPQEMDSAMDGARGFLNFLTRKGRGSVRRMLGWFYASGRAMGYPQICELTMTDIAKLLLVTPAAHSWQCKEMSALVGFPLPGQKSSAATEAYRERQLKIWQQRRAGGKPVASEKNQAAVRVDHRLKRVEAEAAKICSIQPAQFKRAIQRMMTRAGAYDDALQLLDIDPTNFKSADPYDRFSKLSAAVNEKLNAAGAIPSIAEALGAVFGSRCFGMEVIPLLARVG